MHCVATEGNRLDGRDHSALRQPRLTAVSTPCSAAMSLARQRERVEPARRELDDVPVAIGSYGVLVRLHEALRVDPQAAQQLEDVGGQPVVCRGEAGPTTTLAPPAVGVHQAHGRGRCAARCRLSDRGRGCACDPASPAFRSSCAEGHVRRSSDRECSDACAQRRLVECASGRRLELVVAERAAVLRDDAARRRMRLSPPALRRRRPIAP